LRSAARRLSSAAFLVPALAFAQLGGVMRPGGSGGGMGGRRGGPGADEPRRPEIKVATAKEIEKLNPASLLIDRRKKLSLSDSVVAQLRNVEMAIFERNAPLLASYDSIRADFRPPKPEKMADLSPQELSTMRTQFAGMVALLDSLQDRRKRDVKESLELVPEGARKDAGKMLDKQDVDLNDLRPKGAPRYGERRPDRGGER
jgi:hypothetical protein